MYSYEEIVPMAEKMAEEDANKLFGLLPAYQELTSNSKRIKHFHITNLQRANIDLEDYSLIRERAIDLTLGRSNTWAKAISFAVGSGRSTNEICDDYRMHLDGLLTEYMSSYSAPQISKVTMSSEKNSEEHVYAVFLSHANEDRILAHLIKNLLLEFGVTSFVAHDDIEEGEIWEPTIIDAVKHSKIMIVIGTRKIEKSAWVNFETGLAYDQMFPFILEKLNDKVSYVKSKQGIIVTKAVEQSLIKLVRRVLAKLGITTKLTEEQIIALKTFHELQKFIEENYPPNTVEDEAATLTLKGPITAAFKTE